MNTDLVPLYLDVLWKTLLGSGKVPSIVIRRDCLPKEGFFIMYFIRIHIFFQLYSTCVICLVFVSQDSFILSSKQIFFFRFVGTCQTIKFELFGEVRFLPAKQLEGCKILPFHSVYMIDMCISQEYYLRAARSGQICSIDLYVSVHLARFNANRKRVVRRLRYSPFSALPICLEYLYVFLTAGHMEVFF